VRGFAGRGSQPCAISAACRQTRGRAIRESSCAGLPCFVQVRRSASPAAGPVESGILLDQTSKALQADWPEAVQLVSGPG